MKYYANINVNNGTRLEQDLTGNNKRELIKTIREISEGERFEGSYSSWFVGEEGSERLVAYGGMDPQGNRFRYK